MINVGVGVGVGAQNETNKTFFSVFYNGES